VLRGSGHHNQQISHPNSRAPNVIAKASRHFLSVV
jgi:hypothetical protein